MTTDLATWYRANDLEPLIKHPGHPNQSVHAHRGGSRRQSRKLARAFMREAMPQRSRPTAEERAASAGRAVRATGKFAAGAVAAGATAYAGKRLKQQGEKMAQRAEEEVTRRVADKRAAAKAPESKEDPVQTKVDALKDQARGRAEEEAADPGLAALRSLGDSMRRERAAGKYMRKFRLEFDLDAWYRDHHIQPLR